MPVTVPTQDEFTALTARVTALENATPTPPSGPRPPKQAVAAGYSNLVAALSDEFLAAPDIGFNTAGHKWNAGLWYEAVPPTTAFTWSAAAGLTISGASLTSVAHDLSAGATATQGYFEFLATCSNWSAGWLFDMAHAKSGANPCGEIDVYETDQQNPDNVWQTLHSNTGGGGGQADVFNQGKGAGILNPTVGSLVIGGLRKFGCLWQPGKPVQMFLDDTPTVSMAPYPSTSHPMFLVMDCWPGGILHTNGPGTPPVNMTVRYVRTWGP